MKQHQKIKEGDYCSVRQPWSHDVRQPWYPYLDEYDIGSELCEICIEWLVKHQYEVNLRNVDTGISLLVHHQKRGFTLDVNTLPPPLVIDLEPHTSSVARPLTIYE